MLGLVLYQLPLAHDIALAGLTCRALCHAAKLALKLRPFSGESVVLAEHDGEINCVAAAPDGRVITGADEGIIKLWRDSFTSERTMQAHGSHVMAVAVLPGGARFFSSSCDDDLKLWTLDGKLERAFEVGSCVYGIAALPDGVHFVVGLEYGEVRLYHVDGTLVHAFGEHTDLVRAVAVTRDGQHIISGSQDMCVKVWSVATKSLVSTCRGHTEIVNAVAVMPDGQRILSASHDGEVRVWLLDGTLLNTFQMNDDGALALLAMPDNRHALCSSFGTVKLFNVNDGTVLRTFRHHAGDVTSLALLPDGLRFVTVSLDNTAMFVEHGLAPQ